jgi:hypothetical protein
LSPVERRAEARDRDERGRLPKQNHAVVARDIGTSREAIGGAAARNVNEHAMPPGAVRRERFPERGNDANRDPRRHGAVGKYIAGRARARGGRAKIFFPATKTYHDGPLGGRVVHLLELADDVTGRVDRRGAVEGVEVELEVLRGAGEAPGVEAGVAGEGPVEVRGGLGVGLPAVPQGAVGADVAGALAAGGRALGRGRLLGGRLLGGRLLGGRRLLEDGVDVEGSDGSHGYGLWCVQE